MNLTNSEDNNQVEDIFKFKVMPSIDNTNPLVNFFPSSKNSSNMIIGNFFNFLLIFFYFYQYKYLNTKNKLLII